MISVSQVCISFVLHLGIPVIAKSVKPSRIEENLKATQVELDSEDMRQLRGLERNFRFFAYEEYVVDGETVDEFWDVKADEVFTVQQPEEKRPKLID